MLDLTAIPGTHAEQRQLARDMMRRKQNPIALKKAGRKWAVIVLGVPIGTVDSKGAAQSAAFQVGSYRLELGPFAYTYTDGYGKHVS